MSEVVAYKLFKVRKNGTIGPLFINPRQVVELGVWLPAGDYPTNGYAHRPGWHASHRPNAPHLSTKGRRWYKVLLRDVVEYERPESQGGKWFVAKDMKVIEAVDFK